MRSYQDIVEMQQKRISADKKRKFLFFGLIGLGLILLVVFGLLWLQDKPDTDLISGAQYGNTAEVRKALDQGANVTITDEGATPLFYAAVGGHAEIVDLLLRHGANPNTGLNTGLNDEATPLLRAAGNDYPAVVKLLLDYGANPNATDFYGETALMEAAGGGDLHSVQALCQHGADRSLRDKNGWTALDWARRNKNQAIVAYLQSKPKT